MDITDKSEKKRAPARNKTQLKREAITDSLVFFLHWLNSTFHERTSSDVEPSRDFREFLRSAEIVAKNFIKSDSNISQYHFHAYCRNTLATSLRCVLPHWVSAEQVIELSSLNRKSINLVQLSIQPFFPIGHADLKQEIHLRLHESGKALDVLEALLSISDAIEVERTSASKPTDPLQLNRTRNASLGNDFCKGCYYPTERFSKAFTRKADNIDVLCRTASSNILVNSSSLSPTKCCLHKVDMTLEKSRKRACEIPKSKSKSSKNLDELKSAEKTEELTSSKFVTEYRSLRLLTKRNSLYFPSSPRLHIIASALRSQKALQKVEVPRLISAAYDPSQLDHINFCIKNIFHPIRESLDDNGRILFDSLLGCDKELVELQVTSDGFVYRINHMAKKEGAFFQSVQGCSWESAFTRSMKRVEAFIPANAIDDRAWLMSSEKTEGSIAIPFLELHVANLSKQHGGTLIQLFFLSPAWLTKILTAK